MSDNNIPPFEIQIEIIKRAPVKSIIRFRSVSKTWRSFIDSSEFIAGYRTRNTQPRSLLVRYTLLVRYDYKPDYSIKYVSVNDEDTFTQQQDLTPNVPALMKQLSNYLPVIGYSRGLLCLHSDIKEGMLILWNPSIRRCVGILRCLNFYDLFGFAVCPVTNEPTIVKISKPWKVEIFTLSSKRWTAIQCSKPRESELFFEESHVVIGSCIYRVACSYNNRMIVSFDLNAKEFKAIDLPDTITNPITSPIRLILSKLKGSLVVSAPHSEIKVWKMEPDCSFTQLFTINTLHSLTIRNILGFRKNGGLVVETQKTPTHWASALAVYDPCSKQITNLGMSGLSGSFVISSYKETLLLLDHSDSCEYPEIN